jgi:hypothetical protein
MTLIPGKTLRLGDLPKPPDETKPTPKSVRVSLTLPRGLWAQANLRALEDDMSTRQLVALAIAAYLKKEPEPPMPTCEGYGPAPRGGRS